MVCSGMLSRFLKNFFFGFATSDKITIHARIPTA
jgi:hypothetical protein